MTETMILAICFLITFGFIGFKLFGLIKKALIKYSQTIEDNINESERLKIQAVNLLEEAKNREVVILNEIEKTTQLTNQKISNIEKEFDMKLKKTFENLTENSNKKIDFEKNCLINDLTSNVKFKINQVVQEYVKELSDKEKTKATMQAVLKIDFKKLAKKN